jgi:hypothetical protein
MPRISPRTKAFTPDPSGLWIANSFGEDCIVPTNQNDLPLSSLQPDALRGLPKSDLPKSASPEKWLAVLAPILLTAAALALFAR